MSSVERRKNLLTLHAPIVGDFRRFDKLGTNQFSIRLAAYTVYAKRTPTIAQVIAHTNLAWLFLKSAQVDVNG